ncbi:MAG: glycoside hydrolase family 13 [Verrucomicrobia bacterium]|nr:glycoside hydrolase family 13 [Verrucomicrobiota bacterium]
MSSFFERPDTKGRYSGKNNTRWMSFICNAPAAQSVSVVGDFNDWDAAANPMERQVDGNWTAMAQLNHGHHLYVFMVDGKPVLDPRAQGVGRNGKNERVSLVLVS